MRLPIVVLLLACYMILASSRKPGIVIPGEFLSGSAQPLTGAEQTEKYIPYLQGKRVAILGNPTSVIGKRHLVDSLKARGINIVKVFGPEHGFRGNASAGVVVADEIDSTSGIPVISLYGPKNKPSEDNGQWIGYLGKP